MWTFPHVLGAARQRFAEDLKEAERQGRLPTLSPEVGFDLVVGSISQAVWSASEGKLARSETSLIVAGIIRSLGVPAERAARIAANVSVPLPKASSWGSSHEDVGKDVFNPSET